MIIDSQLELSNAQALTATAASTNYIDMSVAGDANRSLRLVIQVSTVLDSDGDAATLDVTIQTDTVANFASPTTIATIAQIAEATLVAGYRICNIEIPPEVCQRYLRVYYTVGTENFTSGNVDAFLTFDAQTNENPS